MKYYKMKNSNTTLQYIVTDKLNSIEAILEDKEDAFLCSVFSSLIAGVVSIKLPHDYQVVYIVLLIITIYFILRIAFKGIHMLKKKLYRELYYRDSKSYDAEELKVKDFFYHVVMNEAIWGISLVNRVADIYANQEMKRFHLCPLYANEACFCFDKVGRLLAMEIFIPNKEKKKRYFDVIGVSSLQSLLKTIYDKIEEMEKNVQDVHLDVERIKEYYDRLLTDLANNK